MALISEDIDRIRNAVIKMLEVNFSIQPAEKVLVLTDVPDTNLQTSLTEFELDRQFQRSELARQVAEIGRLAFSQNHFEYFPFRSTGQNGKEPPQVVSEKLMNADIAMAITSYSMTHTRTRNEATEKGVRIASMPGFLSDMFFPGGAMDADYRLIAKRTLEIQSRLESVSEVKVSTLSGTRLCFSIRGRKKFAETGLIVKYSKPCNLPAGEAGCSPIEESANGKIVLEKGWHKSLDDGGASIEIKNGYIESVTGPKNFVRDIDQILRIGVESDQFRNRRNIAEFGIGTNPNARRTDNTLEAEKILGTIHIGYGNNFFMGGKINADFHSDFIIKAPDVWFDDEIFMQNGEIISKSF